MSLGSKLRSGVKKFQPKKSKKLSLATFIVAFAAIGGIITILMTSAAVPLVVDSSIPQPQNVRVVPDDRSMTVTWDISGDATTVGYYITYKKTGAADSTKIVRQTVHNAIQLQPIDNNSEYEVTVQSARGSYQVIDPGGNVQHDHYGPSKWARANGRVSNPVNIKGTPSSAQVDAQRQRLTGFFDDMNTPSNPLDEKKWNQGTFCERSPEPLPITSGFINPQFHGHNGSSCGFGGIAARPRAVWDTSVGVNGGAASETNPAQLELDMDTMYDGRGGWYLDLIPLDARKGSMANMPMDINAHFSDNPANDHEDMPNMLRWSVGGHGNGWNIEYWDANRNMTHLPANSGGNDACGRPVDWGSMDFRWSSCNMNNKVAGLSPLPEINIKPEMSPQNVRRHYVVQITPTRMKIYQDEVLITNTLIPQEWASKKKYTVQNTAFSYNTGKQFDPKNDRGEGSKGVHFAWNFYHWDNFGFTGPAPTTTINNYLDGGADGRTLHYMSSYNQDQSARGRTAKIQVPDDVGNPTSVNLYMTIKSPSDGSYIWRQGDHILFNGVRYDLPNYPTYMTNYPPNYSTDGLARSNVPVRFTIPASQVRKGTCQASNNSDCNVIVNNMNGASYNAVNSNMHLELEYPKSSAPTYTQPIQIFGANMSKITEPQLTNCDSYVYIEQDLGLPYQAGKPNLTPGPCEYLPFTFAHNPDYYGGAPQPQPTPDTTVPTVTLTDPANNHTLTGNTVVTRATATDNVSINRVEFYAGSPAVLVGTDTTASSGNVYEATIDLNSYAPGTYPIYAIAYDASGLSAQTSARNVIKPQPADTTAPVVTLTSPANNFQVTAGTQSITLSTTATDNVGITRVEFWVDNVQTAALTSPTSGTTYSQAVQTGTYQPGSHSWYVIARDAAGNIRSLQSAPRTFVIPTPPPAQCPTGQTGTPPNCVVPPPPTCPTGQTGTPPNCVTPTPVPNPTPTPNKPGDINGNGRVDRDDLRILLFYYGRTVTANTNGDLNNDGRVNRDDLRVMLFYYLR